MNKIPKFMLMRGYGIGSGIHIVRASVRARMGAMTNMVMDDVRGRRGSFVKSFTASAIGCRRP